MNLKINDFEGPFDLLLFLIKKNKMSIYDVNILEVTKQYLDIIRNTKEMDLEITSEFIVVAATLLEIKSKEMLPKEKDESEEISEEDAQKKLLNRIIEYTKFKEVAAYLKEKQGRLGYVYSKLPEVVEDNSFTSNEEMFKNVDVISLFELYFNIILRFEEKQNTSNVIEKEIPIDMFRIEDKMDTIRNIFKTEKYMKFSNIYMETNSKIEKVVTFLAILELIRMKEIKVFQNNNFEEIFLEKEA